MVLAVGNDALFRQFCEVIEAPELAEDPRFATNRGRVEHQKTLRPLIADRLRRRPRQHWIDRLSQAGVPCGAVRDLAQVLSDPQLAERMMVLPMTHPTAGPMHVLGRDFRFACPRWHLYTPESRRAHEILFGVQSSSSRGRHLSPR